MQKQDIAVRTNGEQTAADVFETHSAREYFAYLHDVRTPALEPIPAPEPKIPKPKIPNWSFLRGSRMLIWKQDPSINEPGIRRVFLPLITLAGPHDARMNSLGLPVVAPDKVGDFIQFPGSDAFDVVHTYAVARMTLLMFERVLGRKAPWAWNSPTNTDALNVYAHGLPGVKNAYYSRNERALRFGDFIGLTKEHVYICRSLDVVAHEAGHAVLDGLKPMWLGWGNSPQTGGLHEAFGDLATLFLILSQLDMVEFVIAFTKANLHDKSCLSALAEQFAKAGFGKDCLRDMDNNLKLSQVGTEVHAISQVFTGAIYDILADIFAFERNPSVRDDAIVLYETAQYLLSLVVRAYVAAPDQQATYATVVNKMLSFAAQDGTPKEYRNFIRNQFTIREVVVSPTPLTEDIDDEMELMADIQDDPEAIPDMTGTCGTMQLPEYLGGEEALQAEIEEFAKSLRRKVSTKEKKEPVPSR